MAKEQNEKLVLRIKSSTTLEQCEQDMREAWVDIFATGLRYENSTFTHCACRKGKSDDSQGKYP
jgi:hypothetical protein